MGDKGESSAAKAARDRYSALAQQYEAKRKEYQDLVNQNTGQKGYERSLVMAAQEAGRMSVSQAQQAANQAIQAGRAAGGSRASAAMNVMNAAGNTYAQTYNENMQNQQNQAASALGSQVSGQATGLVSQQKELDMQQNVLKQQREADDKNYQNSFMGRLGGIAKGVASGVAGGAAGGIGGMVVGGIAGGIGGAL